MSRYGAIAKAMPHLGPDGKVFFVVPSSAPYMADFQNTFPPDEDGVTRVYTTVQGAVDAWATQPQGRGDVILVMPGLQPNDGYNESVTVSRKRAATDDDSGGPLTIVGAGPLGSVAIAPSTAGAEGMEVREDDVTLINIGVAGNTTGDHGIRVYGARFRAYRCKFEGADTSGAAIILGPGTAAQVDTDFTHGDGGDARFEDCEGAWTYDAVRLVASDFGAVTQPLFLNCRFHNFSNSAFEETGGTVSIRFRNLQIVRCYFDDQEGGTAPTKYISLNDDNGNDGIVTGCHFPTAINSGLNLVSTALHWVSNFHTGGVSTGQPS